MMTFEQILILVAGGSPAVAAIIGIVITAFKLIKKFNSIKNEILDTKEYTTLKDQLVLVNKENRELKRKLNELLTKIDKIDRSNEA